ncbi:hypothetical protein M272_16970 [Vibrio natriegens NBRC 15636 = ATCC 14048 = DSM 759]|nr:hypothetical protein M272_16970 [Vibrio natriegens NBRC 15636 = ATCC 14048 = DSM 759]
MVSRPKVWIPAELCKELGISALELTQLITKARKQGVEINRMSDTRTGNTNKIWIVQ